MSCFSLQNSQKKRIKEGSMTKEYVGKWYCTVLHIRTCIENWVRHYIEDYETAERIATEYIYKQLYDHSKSPYLWNYERFTEWYESKTNNRICEYCGQSEDDLIAFCEHVNRYRYQKGQAFVTSRRVCFMRDYKDEDFRYSFASQFMKLGEDRDSEIRTILIPAIESKLLDADFETSFMDELLYLPAPYNPDNCVLACYWCNNAKTDAFTDKEFKPIGDIIGKTIKSIINDQGSTL